MACEPVGHPSCSGLDMWSALNRSRTAPLSLPHRVAGAASQQRQGIAERVSRCAARLCRQQQ